MNIKMADKLVELRKKFGLSQEELADRLNISRQAVSKWERAESSPDTDNLIALSKLYHITIDEMLNSEKASEVSQTERGKIVLTAYPMDYKLALKITSFIFLGLGLLFVILGTGLFCGLTMPESRNLKLAQNEMLTSMNAEVKSIERTVLNSGGEAMYKVVFEWANEFSQGKGKSNAVYSKTEADAMIGKTVQIRVDKNRAVMLDYHRSNLSLLGIIFIGVFGGLGVIFICIFVLLAILKRHINGNKI